MILQIYFYPLHRYAVPLPTLTLGAESFIALCTLKTIIAALRNAETDEKQAVGVLINQYALTPLIFQNESVFYTPTAPQSNKSMYKK